MMWRRSLIDLFSSQARRCTEACSIPRSYSTKAKTNNIQQSETSKARKRELDSAIFFQRDISYPKTPRIPFPRDTKWKLPSDKIPPKKCEVKKAVQRILPSVVTLTLSTATSKKMLGGIIVDPLGYIITSAEDMDSQKKEDLSKFKVDVHLNPGMPSEYTLAGEVSYVDLVNKLAIVKCKSDKPLEIMAAKFNFMAYTGDFVLYVSTTCGHNNTLPNSLCADLVMIIREESTRPVCLKNVKSCVFSSSTEQEKLYGFAIVNLDGELVGLVKDSVNLCATPAIVISKVFDTAKEFGNCQPWIGVDMFPIANGNGRPYIVRSVVPNSPADMAGVVIGDEIFKLDVELYNLLLLNCGLPVKIEMRTKTGCPGNTVIVPQMKRQARDPFV